MMKKKTQEEIDCRKAADFLKALGHPSRIGIVLRLMMGKKCVSEMENNLNIKQPNISQHLSVLKACGVVDCDRFENKKCYFLKNPKVISTIFKEFFKHGIIEHIKL